MSPLLIAGLVVLVLGLGAVVRHTDPHPQDTFPDAHAATQHFARAHPEAPITKVSLSTDGITALLMSGPDRIGVVTLHGQHAVVRLWTARDLRPTAPRPDGLTLRSRDPAMPALRVKLSELERTQWLAALHTLQDHGGRHAS